jgi:hypothetical protein
MEPILNLLRVVILGALAVATVAFATMVGGWAVRDARGARGPNRRLPPEERAIAPGDTRKVIARIGRGGRRWA